LLLTTLIGLITAHHSRSTSQLLEANHTLSIRKINIKYLLNK
jgi:hypothetical protein